MERFARSVNGCGQGKIGTLGAAEHDAGASAVFLRINDLKAVIAGLFDAGNQRAKVSFLSLVGPTAFSVGVRLVDQAAVGRLAKVQIRKMQFFIRKAQIEDIISPFRIEEQSQEKGVSLRCVVFDPVADVAGDHHISGGSRQYQGFDRPFVQQPLLSVADKFERFAVPCNHHPMEGIYR